MQNKISKKSKKATLLLASIMLAILSSVASMFSGSPQSKVYADVINDGPGPGSPSPGCPSGPAPCD